MQQHYRQRIDQLILASGSPYRRQLLKTTGLKFSTIVSKVDESRIIDGTPLIVAGKRASAKALSVGQDHPTSLVIGCDQVLDFAGKNLPKATSAEQVIDHLQMLSGKSHTLHSAYSLYHAKGQLSLTDVVSVIMQVRELTSTEIKNFVARNEWSATVGCYRYETSAINLFQAIDGSEQTIVGLPLLQLLAKLRQLGINPLVQANPPWEITQPCS